MVNGGSVILNPAKSWAKVGMILIVRKSRAPVEASISIMGYTRAEMIFLLKAAFFSR